MPQPWPQADLLRRAVRAWSDSHRRSSRQRIASERVPGRLLGQLEIADIDAEPGADAGADRHQQHVVVLQHVEADARHDIGRARNAAEAIVEAADSRRDCRPASSRASLRRRNPSRATGPARTLYGRRHSWCRACLRHRSGRRPARPSPPRPADSHWAGRRRRNLLDHGGEPTRRRAEELVTGIDDLLSGIFLGPRGRARQRGRRQRKTVTPDEPESSGRKIGKTCFQSPSGSTFADALPCAALSGRLMSVTGKLCRNPFSTINLRENGGSKAVSGVARRPRCLYQQVVADGPGFLAAHGAVYSKKRWKP